MSSAGVSLGDVFFAYLGTIRNPKDKYFIVVCAEDPVRLVVINTRNAAVVLDNPALGPTQVYITPADLQALNYASWVGCDALFATYSYDDLVKLVASGKRVGNVGPVLLEKIRVAISNSPTIPERQKARCVAQIQDALQPQPGASLERS